MRLWVLNGVLELHLPMDLLEVIAEKYLKIGCMPPGDYCLPELYSCGLNAEWAGNEISLSIDFARFLDKTPDFFISTAA